MEYIARFDDKELTLKQPTPIILEEMEKAGKIIEDKNRPIKERLKKMYDVTKANATSEDDYKTIVGEFGSADPNIINIFYFEMIRCYNAPIEDYQAQGITEQIDKYDLQNLLKLVDKVEKLK